MTHANERRAWGRKGADDAESGKVVWAVFRGVCDVVRCGQRNVWGG